MNRNIQRSMPIVLSTIGSIGVVATGILVAKAAEKTNKNIREAKEKNDKKGAVKAFFKGYYPALIVGGATISSIVAGTIISKRTEMSLTATTLMLDATLRRYKGKLKEVFGDKAEIITDSILNDEYKKLPKESKELTDGEMMYCEEHVGCFKAKPSDFEAAICLMNEKIQFIQGWASLRQFLEDCHAKMVNNGFDIDNISYDYGWYKEYIDDVVDATSVIDITHSSFLHVNKEPHYDANGVVDYYMIKFDVDPIFGVTEENVSRLGLYNASSLGNYADEEDAQALAYDEFKDLKPIKKKKVIINAKNDR